MKDDIATACRLLATLLEQGDRCSVATVQEARAFVDRHASHVVVGVTRDEAGHVQPVVVSADVPADRTETCAVPAGRRNCWTCRRDAPPGCNVAPGEPVFGAVVGWVRQIDRYWGGFGRRFCPPEATGCPGWEARP